MGSQVIEAVMWGSRDALLDALQRGGDANDTENGQSALMMACVQDRDDLAADLIRHGADPNAKAADESTPLFIAVGLGSHGLSSVLIAASANVNAVNNIGQTPLMVASKSGCDGVVELLLNAGASVTARDHKRLNALHWAVTGGDFPSVASLLIAYGADPGEKTVNGQSALDYAISLQRHGMIKSLREALQGIRAK